MSKEAALRAMREARYNARSAGSATASTPVKPAARLAKAPSAEPDAPASPADALCGHRSMNGRTCTREHGHAAKSHRYSSRRPSRPLLRRAHPDACPENELSGTVTAPDGSVKKSLPLSSTTMKAGKSSTSIFQTASMPSSGYSSTSTRT